MLACWGWVGAVSVVVNVMKFWLPTFDATPYDWAAAEGMFLEVIVSILAARYVFDKANMKFERLAE